MKANSTSTKAWIKISFWFTYCSFSDNRWVARCGRCVFAVKGAPTLYGAGKYASAQISPVALVVKNPCANAGDIRDTGSIPGLGRSPRGGHGNPLQYCCLENPMDRGAWWATVHRTAKIANDWSDLASSTGGRKTRTYTDKHVHKHILLKTEAPRGFSQSPCLLGSFQESEETQTFFQPNNPGRCSDGYREHAVSLQIPHSRGRFHTLSLFFSPPLDLERLAPSCWEAISAEDVTSSTGVAGATGWGAKRKKKKKRRKGPQGNLI